jgi:tetratricopeptide (TPR) repeat protein
VSSIVAAPEPAPAGPSSAGTADRTRRRFAGVDILLGACLAGLLALLALTTTAGADLGSTWGEIALTGVGAAVCVGVILFGARGRASGATVVVLFAALTAFTALSIAWSIRPDQSWLAANEGLAYLAAFAGAAGLARLCPGRWPAVLGGLAVVATALSAYALLVKVFPSLDTTDTLGRLQAPFGYWNATGLCAALGLAPCLWAGARREGGRALRALAVPATTILISVIVLSYSRSAVLAGIAALAVWFATVPLRLRGALVLGLGGAGAALTSGWFLADHTLTTDNLAAVARLGAGHSFGLVLALTLVALAIAGVAVVTAIDGRSVSARTSRRIGATLLVLASLVPLGGVVVLATSSRGLTGEVSHIWGTLTNPQATVGDNAGRLIQFGNSRAEYWREGLKVGGQAPLNGVGALAFGTARTRYATSVLVAQNAHSYVIETYADLGLIGVGISLALLIAWSIAARLALRRGRSWSELSALEAGERAGLLTLLAVVIAFGVQSAIDWTWFIPGVTVPALLAAGWLAGRGALEHTVGVAHDRRPLTERAGAAAIAAGLVTLALLGAWIIWQPLRSSDADAAAFNALARGDTASAFADARTAVTSNPLSADPLFELSALYSATREQGAARAELQKAITLQPENFNTWLQLGEFEIQQKRPRAALAALHRAVVLNPPLQATQAAIAQAQQELRPG